MGGVYAMCVSVCVCVYEHRLMGSFSLPFTPLSNFPFKIAHATFTTVPPEIPGEPGTVTDLCSRSVFYDFYDNAVKLS